METDGDNPYPSVWPNTQYLWVSVELLHTVERRVSILLFRYLDGTSLVQPDSSLRSINN